ncbi:hypothetical protein [Nocardioides dilutus]
MLARVALAALVVTVALGLTMLTGLVRSGRPLPRLVLFHLVAAVSTLAAWTAYVVGDDRAWLAWAVFALLVVVNTLGDTLMVQGWRARAVRAGVTVPTGARAYLAAARDVLSFARPTAAVHALLAPVAFFSVLLVALGVGD